MHLKTRSTKIVGVVRCVAQVLAALVLVAQRFFQNPTLDGVAARGAD